MDLVCSKLKWHKAIEIYNNKPHMALYMMTPNHMEECWFEEQNKNKFSYDDKKTNNQMVPGLS